MRKVNFILAAAMLMVSAAVMAQQASKVYLTREISPESLVKIYKALGVEAKGRVAVKMSTGEGSNPNYLKPELVKNPSQSIFLSISWTNTMRFASP